MWFTAAPKPLKIQVLGVTQPPGVAQPLYSRGHNYTRTCNMCPSLIEIGSKTAEKNSAQTNRQTDRETHRHYENNGHLAVNQLSSPELHTTTYIHRKTRATVKRDAVSLSSLLSTPWTDTQAHSQCVAISLLLYCSLLGTT